jgi:hypothetical protein
VGDLVLDPSMDSSDSWISVFHWHERYVAFHGPYAGKAREHLLFSWVFWEWIGKLEQKLMRRKVSKNKAFMFVSFMGFDDPSSITYSIMKYFWCFLPAMIQNIYWLFYGHSSKLFFVFGIN